GASEERVIHDAVGGSGEGVVADEKGGVEGDLNAYHHTANAGSGTGKEFDCDVAGTFEVADEEACADRVAVFANDGGSSGFGCSADGRVDVVGHHASGEGPVRIGLVGAAALHFPACDAGYAFDVRRDEEPHDAEFLPG